MTAAYFEDHPTDPDKVILRKPKHDFGEPWSPVSIGVDVTEAGAHVIGIYAMSDDTSQIFYSKFYPAPQRTWVGLTDVLDFIEEFTGAERERHPMFSDGYDLALSHVKELVEAKLKENT